MEQVEKFIDSQLVYSQYWIEENRPEVAARMFLEAVFYLHYVSNTFKGHLAWRAGINLDSLLKYMVVSYLKDDDFIKILSGELLYHTGHVRVLQHLMASEDKLHMKLIYGCISKILIPHKPNIAFMDTPYEFLKSATILMSKSRSKKIICSPDSELVNDQYNATKWIDIMMNLHRSKDDYTTLVVLSAVTDVIILSYMQRVSKFKDLFESVKRLCINDVLTNTNTIRK